MFCADCGKELKPGKKFCIYCGEPIPEEIQNIMAADMKPAVSKETEKKPVENIQEPVVQMSDGSGNIQEPIAQMPDNSGSIQEPVAQVPEGSGNIQEPHEENRTEKEQQPDEITENGNAEIIQEDDDPNKTVLIVEDRGEDTLILSETDNNVKTDDVDKIEDTDIPTTEPEPAAEEDDGETELVEMDPNRTDAGKADKAGEEAFGSGKASQPKTKHDKELKYLNNTINDPGNEGAANVHDEKKSGGTSLIIKVLLVILIILVLVAAGLAAYFYVDSVKMREKFANAEEDSVSAVHIDYPSDYGEIA